MRNLKLMVVEEMLRNKIENFDKEAVIAEIDELPLIKSIPNMVVTADNYREIKAMLPEISKLKKKIDNARLTPERELKKRLDTYKAQCKSIMAYVQSKYDELKAKTDVYDDIIRKEHEKIAMDYIAELNGKYDVNIKYSQSYENLTMTETKIKKAIDEQLADELQTKAEYEKNCEAIRKACARQNKNLITKLDEYFYINMLATGIHVVEVLDNIAEHGEKQAEIERNAKDGSKSPIAEEKPSEGKIEVEEVEAYETRYDVQLLIRNISESELEQIYALIASTEAYIEEEEF